MFPKTKDGIAYEPEKAGAPKSDIVFPSEDVHFDFPKHSMRSRAMRLCRISARTFGESDGSIPLCRSPIRSAVV